MAQLEDITVGASLAGMAGNAPVSVVAVKWCGNAVLEITFKDVRGQLASQLLYREDKERRGKQAADYKVPDYYDYDDDDIPSAELEDIEEKVVNSQMASRRTEELEARMQKRLVELETEKLISAMLPGLLDRPDTFATDVIARRDIELATIQTVMGIETSLDCIPVDVNAENAGYDVEPRMPRDRRDAGGETPRFIETKGREAGVDTVIVSKNKILTPLNKLDEYILAIVEPERMRTRSIYLKKPFCESPDFAATSVNYNIAELVNGSDTILKRGVI